MAKRHHAPVWGERNDVSFKYDLEGASARDELELRNAETASRVAHAQRRRKEIGDNSMNQYR